MGERRLKTAVLGLSSGGKLVVEAASQVGYFELQAVADREGQVAERTAQEYGCEAYDDYRQLLAQNQFDCVLVGAPIHSCEEHLRAAIRKKCNILKLWPPARNFEEAVELHRLSEAEGIKFAVANPWRFAEAFLALREEVEQGRVEHIFLVSMRGDFATEVDSAWRADPKLAGGGVLLHRCYGLVDQLVWNFGVPAQVYALNVNKAGDRQQRFYRTEDAAVLALRFSDSFIGYLTASPSVDTEAPKEVMEVFGTYRTVTVSPNCFAVYDREHGSGEQRGCEYDESGCMQRALENFALSILWPDKNALCSSLVENLENLAVIEASYLSARTGMPEEPVRVLRMLRRESTFMWPGHNE